jgi:hypothetical protein
MAGKRQPVRYTRQQVHHTKSRWLSLPGIGIFIAIFTAFALWVDKLGVSPSLGIRIDGLNVCGVQS